MSDNNHTQPSDREYDLADFTDKVLSSEPVNLSEDKTQKELEEMVLAVKAHTATPPSDEVKEKIKASAQAAYQQTFAQAAEPQKQRDIFSIFKREKNTGYQSQKQRQRTAAIQVAISAVAIVAILALALPLTAPDGTTGTASGELGLWLPIGILVVTGIAIIWLWNKDK